ncbi:hypothetical protein ACFWOJ_37015 [Streptomyces sp. NPDC058439]|uniref:hypothetical protein n=1 Tax=Streptomyces sp. NPDC058439 TaxID=3346500 RepID=UPI0036513966
MLAGVLGRVGRGPGGGRLGHIALTADEQIALQLTGHARAVAADVRRHAAALPKSDGRGALAEVVLREADGRLSAALEGTAGCAQNRALLVRVLYTRLDRLTEAAPAARPDHG